MMRWPVTETASPRPRSRAPRLTPEEHARKLDFLARRLDLSGEPHSADLARLLARSHRAEVEAVRASSILAPTSAERHGTYPIRIPPVVAADVQRESARRDPRGLGDGLGAL